MMTYLKLLKHILENEVIIISMYESFQVLDNGQLIENILTESWYEIFVLMENLFC